MPKAKSSKPIAPSQPTPISSVTRAGATVRLKVGILVDIMGSSIASAEEEVENHKELIMDELPTASLTFYQAFHAGSGKSGIHPNTHLLLFDYGGMMPGCSDLLESNARQLIKWASDNPSSLCLVMSSFTYRGQIKAELEEQGLEELPNVVNYFDKFEIPEWFRMQWGCPKMEVVDRKAHKLRQPSRTERKRTDCFRCDGTGTICVTCGESEKVCKCMENGGEPEYSECEDCKGTGE